MFEGLFPAAVCMMAWVRGGREILAQRPARTGSRATGSRDRMAGRLRVLVGGGREGKAERASRPQTCEVTGEMPSRASGTNVTVEPHLLGSETTKSQEACLEATGHCDQGQRLP